MQTKKARKRVTKTAKKVIPKGKLKPKKLKAATWPMVIMHGTATLKAKGYIPPTKF